VRNKKIAILGAGSWERRSLSWQPETVARRYYGGIIRSIWMLLHKTSNKRYLPEHPFPVNLAVTSDLAEVAAFSNLILVCVPSHAFKNTLIKLKPYLSNEIKIAWATKGSIR